MSTIVYFKHRRRGVHMGRAIWLFQPEERLLSDRAIKGLWRSLVSTYCDRRGEERLRQNQLVEAANSNERSS